MYKILIVEDDTTIAKLVQNHLQKWDFEVLCAMDLKNVTGAVVDFEPQLVLMDILLPFYNGFYWCGEIRKFSKLSIMFLSSANDNMNIVMAMNMGGDDFVEKPFDLNVLTAKVQALLGALTHFRGNQNVLECRGLILNLSNATVTYQDTKVELTKNEFKILQMMMENEGKIVKRDRLIERLWESDEFIDDNTLTVNVTRLRRKLEDIGVKDYILTRKGIGYLIE